MIGVKTSAPGKAVVSGEYAVLTGAPAIAVALNRRVSVSIERSILETHRVTSPGFAAGEFCFSVDREGLIRWPDEQGAGKFLLLEQVWRHCAPRQDHQLAIEIDSQSFFAKETGAKLGIGSSAAVTCALSVALAKFANAVADVSAVAFAAHRDLQNKQGSGVDVAASLNGGVIEYRTDNHRHCEPLDWPSALRYQYFWSGRPASTVNRVDRFLRAGKSPTAAALTNSATEVANAWRGGQATEILDVLPSYIKCLASVCKEYELGIFAAGHAQMLTLASEIGIVYKPCGAGGGDIGIALAADEDLLEEFRGKSSALGFTSLDCRIDSQGVAIDELT